MTNLSKNSACIASKTGHRGRVGKLWRAASQSVAAVLVGIAGMIAMPATAQVYDPTPMAPPALAQCQSSSNWVQIRPNTLGLDNFTKQSATGVDASGAGILSLPAGSIVLDYTNATSVDGPSGAGHTWQVDRGEDPTPYSEKATFAFSGPVPVRIRAQHGAILPGPIGVRDGILSEDGVEYRFVPGNLDTDNFAEGRLTYQGGLNDYSIRKTGSADNFRGGTFWVSTGFAEEVSFYATSSSTTSNHSIWLCHAESDLSIEKAIDNPTPNVGASVIFTLTATNNGPDSAPGVVVTDQLPSGYAYVSDNGGGATVENSGEIVWTIGTLANGADVSLQITATVLATGDYANTATIAGDYPDPDLSNNSTTVTPVPVFAPPVASGDDSLGNPVGGTVTLDVAANDTAATGRALDPGRPSLTLPDEFGG